MKQNLLALVFRPLRLVVDAASLRQFRILILKATHAPFVGIIYAYEASRLFSSHRSSFPPASLLGSSMHPSNSGHHPSQLGSRQKAALKGELTQDSDSPTRPHDSIQGDVPSALSTADISEMLTLMRKLTAQVDELTARSERRDQ